MACSFSGGGTGGSTLATVEVEVVLVAEAGVKLVRVGGVATTGADGTAGDGNEAGVV